ncbi:hypothetical protein GCM10010924_46950 [Rhizobium wenxiniae]|nr:hypothetical protein GCM10010924_46950 [Rhizobium wenxiniae]
MYAKATAMLAKRIVVTSVSPNPTLPGKATWTIKSNTTQPTVENSKWRLIAVHHSTKPMMIAGNTN